MKKFLIIPVLILAWLVSCPFFIWQPWQHQVTVSDDSDGRGWIEINYLEESGSTCGVIYQGSYEMRPNEYRAYVTHDLASFYFGKTTKVFESLSSAKEYVHKFCRE